MTPRWQLLLVYALVISAGAVGMQRTSDTANSAKTNAEDVVVLAKQNRTLIGQINRETAERRHQQCMVFERDARAAIEAVDEARESLANTKRYLRQLTPAEHDTTLNRFVRQGLPRQRAEIKRAQNEARANAAPLYCDEPGVGLPE